MLKISVCGVLALAMLAPSVAYAEDVLLNNTIVTTAGGQSTQWLFDADGGYQSIAPDGAHSEGAWRLEGGRLCVTPAGGADVCMPWSEGRTPGERWSASNDAGAAFEVEIRAGRS